MSTASGARALFGIGLEKQIPGQQIGAPCPIALALTAPTAPTSAEGIAGLLTGTFVWYVSFVFAGRGETAASAATTVPLVLSLHKATVTIPVYAGSAATCLGRRIYRSSDGGTTKPLVTEIWNNTATTFTDNIPIGSEHPTKVAKSGSTGANAEQTGANFGLKFIRPDVGSDLQRKDSYGKSTEMTGRLGQARGIPMATTYTQKLDVEARTSALIPLLASMVGLPTVMQVTDEPTLIYDFPLSDLTADSVSLFASWYEGGDLRPGIFMGMKTGDIDFAVSEKKWTQIKANLVGTNDTENAFGTVKTGAATYGFMPVLRGPRLDANAYTDSIFVKITTAPAEADGIGTFVVKVARAAAGGSPSYGSTALIVYYDPTTGRQCHPAAIGNDTATDNQGAWIELFDSTSAAAIGADVGENRKPVMIYFPDDVSGLALNDEWEFLAQQPVFGIYSAANPTGPADDGSFTGQAPRFELPNRFTPAHVIIKRGPDAGGLTLLDVQDVGVKLSRPIDAVVSLGPEAANPSDVDVFGQVDIELDFGKRLKNREFERAMKQDERLYTSVVFQGPPIIVDQVLGTLSTYREKIALLLPQARVESTSSPLASDKALPEKIKIMAEQPDNEELDVMTLQVVSTASYDFAAI